jgi:hypothetical protein
MAQPVDPFLILLPSSVVSQSTLHCNFMLIKFIRWAEVYILSKKNTETLVVACEKTGVEVNADKTKCIFMSRDQNVGQ